jgi:MarR family transcriptional regulator, transcriptional regulator for hemolysin
MPRPTRPPIGLTLNRIAKAVNRAFDDALAEAGGSMPSWQIMITLKSRQLSNQRELADAVGIRGATLTHHLNAMETAGLLTRRRDPENRRIHLVELTAEGESAFRRMRDAAASFDQQLRSGLTDEEIGNLERLLHTLCRNVTDDDESAEPPS